MALKLNLVPRASPLMSLLFSLLVAGPNFSRKRAARELLVPRLSKWRVRPGVVTPEKRLAILKAEKALGTSCLKLW